MVYLVSKRFVPFNVSSHSAIYLGALVVKNQCEGTFDLNVRSSHIKLVQLCDCSCADLLVSFGFGLGRKLFSLSISLSLPVYVVERKAHHIIRLFENNSNRKCKRSVNDVPKKRSPDYIVFTSSVHYKLRTTLQDLLVKRSNNRLDRW